jgi:hypothetical protein
MNRFFALAQLATRYRPLVQLALVAGARVAIGLGAGAPECPGATGC